MSREDCNFDEGITQQLIPKTISIKIMIQFSHETCTTGPNDTQLRSPLSACITHACLDSVKIKNNNSESLG